MSSEIPVHQLMVIFKKCFVLTNESSVGWMNDVWNRVEHLLTDLA